MFQKGQIVRVIDEDLKRQMLLIEVALLGHNKPDFQGEVLAVNPSPEEFAKIDPNFAAAVETGEYDGSEPGVVYFDKGVGRPYWFQPEHLEIVNNGGIN